MRKQLKQLLFRSLTQVIGDREGFVTLPVLRGPIAGAKFRVDLVQRHESAYIKGSYDAEVLRRLASWCRAGWVVWDCGIYLGYYTVFFSKVVGAAGSVFAIEPDRTNRQRAEGNCRLNHCQNVTFIDAAVGNPESVVEFCINATSNSHFPGTYVGGDESAYKKSVKQQFTMQRVRSVSLDDLISVCGKEPHLVKLDIEGAERFALQHADKLLTQIRPLILLELHNRECDSAAWQFAQRYDYALQDVPTGRWLTTRDEVHGTLICVPHEKTRTFFSTDHLTPLDAKS